MKRGKVHLITCYEGTEGKYRYSSIIALNLPQDGVGGQRHAPADLSTGKNRYPFYRRLGGPQVLSAWARKISPPTGFGPRTVETAASCYTDYAIVPTHRLI